MFVVSVGQPYIAGRSSFDQNGPTYNYSDGIHELLLSFPDVSPVEVRSVQTGPAKFGLFVFERVIFFLFNFSPAFGWSDCPYSFWQLAPEQRSLPVFEEHMHILLSVILIDGPTNTVKALRATTLSPAFSELLSAAIVDQLAAPISKEDYLGAVARAQARWPTSEEMYAESIARCAGGE